MIMDESKNEPKLIPETALSLYDAFSTNKQSIVLRKTREETPAKKIELVGEIFMNEIKLVPSSQLKLGDHFVASISHHIALAPGAT